MNLKKFPITQLNQTGNPAGERERYTRKENIINFVPCRHKCKEALND